MKVPIQSISKAFLQSSALGHALGELPDKAENLSAIVDASEQLVRYTSGANHGPG